jgi:hypothetical protein
MHPLVSLLLLLLLVTGLSVPLNNPHGFVDKLREHSRECWANAPVTQVDDVFCEGTTKLY